MSSGIIFSPFSSSDLQATFLPSQGTVTIGSQLFSLPLPLSALPNSNQVYLLSTSITAAITTPWTPSSPRSLSPSGSQTLTCFKFFHFFPPLSDSMHSNLACTPMFLKKLPRDDWMPSFPMARASAECLSYQPSSELALSNSLFFSKLSPSLVSITQ